MTAKEAFNIILKEAHSYYEEWGEEIPDELFRAEQLIHCLVVKATPRKRIFIEEKGGISAHDECPNCRVKVSPIRCYCDNCGQRLE